MIHGDTVLNLRPGHAYFFPGNTPVRRRRPKHYANYYLRFRVEWFPGIDVLGDILAAHIQLHARFEPVFLHVERNVRADLRVTELARVHGTALHAFSIAFRRAVGFSPKHYIDRRLNEEVVWRLLNIDAPAKQIAVDLGFNNEYYFSRFCSRMNGHPPARLRRNLVGRTTALG